MLSVRTEILVRKDKNDSQAVGEDDVPEDEDKFEKYKAKPFSAFSYFFFCSMSLCIATDCLNGQDEIRIVVRRRIRSRRL